MIPQSQFRDPYPFAIFHEDGTPVEHNLFGSEVVEFFDDTDGRKYLLIPQHHEHRAEEANECEECKAEYAKFIEEGRNVRKR